jgi:hypothetical protein
MIKNPQALIVRISDASLEIFGESNDTNRKRIRKLINRGLLTATQLTGEGRSSPYWVTRSSLDALTKTLKGCDEPDQAA